MVDCDLIHHMVLESARASKLNKSVKKEEPMSDDDVPLVSVSQLS